MMVEQAQHQQKPAPTSNGCSSNGASATIKQELTIVSTTPTAKDASNASRTDNHAPVAVKTNDHAPVAVKTDNPSPVAVKTDNHTPVAVKQENDAVVKKDNKPVPDLPREVLQYAPLLVGKYYIQDKRAVWSGVWGMSEAAFGPNGIISPFEMKSQDDVSIQTCAGAADSVHPSLSGLALARSSSTTNAAVTQVSPVYLGYETDANVRSAMPFLGKYSGSFQIQAVKGKHQTVLETDVEIRFVHDAGTPSQFVVSGLGENRFGKFTLHGFMDKETSELRLYKVYKPKDPPKRALPRRARSARAATPAVKREVKALSISAPGVSAITANVDATRIMTPLAGPTIVAPRKVGTPMSDYSSPSLVLGRSERKRSIPAHLREDNILELDHAPMSMKKCLSVLKGVMANPKSAPFMAPVDPVALGIPDYFHVIKEPMDLGTVRSNLEIGFYDSPTDFADHVRLVFRNAMLYNAAHSQVHIYARKLMDDFEKRYKGLNIKLSTRDKLSGLKSKKSDSIHSSKKIRGGKGTKGNTKRSMSGDETGLIMSLKEDIERLKATLEQLQPSMARAANSKPMKAAARPFKMEDLTEEELNEPMSQMDKARLSADIKLLPQDKINRVLQIIAEAVPVAKLANENDEVELDINAFDTRCLRMLEGYVRENGIGRKRKRPVKKSKMAPADKRLKSAKVAALNIRNRQEELKSALAAIDGDASGVARAVSGENVDRRDQDAAMTDVEAGAKKGDASSSGSSSSSSESSDSDSDSDSESDSDDGGAPLERSPPLASAPSLSQLDPTASGDAAKKIRDEQLSSAEPLRVENRGAWSMLAKKETPNGTPLPQSNANQSSSLWLSARSMEQIKQQKIQQKIQQKEKERTDELEALKRRETELRLKEKKREETERRKFEQEQAVKLAEEKRLRDERAREAERVRLAQLAMEREKLSRDDDVELHDATLSEDLDAFSSSSFL